MAEGNGGGLFLIREKIHLLLVKPAGIGCVITKAVKHGRILSHGGAQVDLPKLYCHDLAIPGGQQAQAAIRLQTEDATRQRFLVSLPDIDLFAVKERFFSQAFTSSPVGIFDRHAINTDKISRNSSERFSGPPNSASTLVPGKSSSASGGLDPTSTLTPMPSTTVSRASPVQTDSTRIPATFFPFNRTSLGHLICDLRPRFFNASSRDSAPSPVNREGETASCC